MRKTHTQHEIFNEIDDGVYNFVKDTIFFRNVTILLQIRMRPNQSDVYVPGGGGDKGGWSTIENETIK